MSKMPRCLGCGYFLHGLPAQKCPECGRDFNLNDSATFSTIPPLVRWRYWLPGFLLALVVAFAFYLLLIKVAGFNVAVTLVMPTCIGTLIGYGCRARYFVLVMLGLAVVVGCLFGLYSMSIVGVFCGVVMAGIAIVPILIGTFAGWLLRTVLKSSQWEQRWHLPALGILLVPVLWGTVEALVWHPYANESLSTTITIPAPVSAVWDSLMFYEEVHHKPPFLLRFALPRPLYTQGQIQHIGDKRTCVYTHGHLVKQVTERKVNEKLAFDVIEQTHVMNHSVHLVSGSFEFKPQGSATTAVTLTTRYEPQLGPRWIWRPFERLGMHTLHKFVLDGMGEKAAAEKPG